MNVVFDFVAHPRLPIESQEEESGHVERGHERGAKADQPKIREATLGGTPRLPENLVLRKEARQGWDARNRERCDEHRFEGSRNAPAQIAHVAHVLLAAQGMDHRTRTEEEQRLEERVCENVENA